MAGMHSGRDDDYPMRSIPPSDDDSDSETPGADRGAYDDNSTYNDDVYDNVYDDVYHDDMQEPAGYGRFDDDSEAVTPPQSQPPAYNVYGSYSIYEDAGSGAESGSETSPDDEESAAPSGDLSPDAAETSDWYGGTSTDPIWNAAASDTGRLTDTQQTRAVGAIPEDTRQHPPLTDDPTRTPHSTSAPRTRTTTPAVTGPAMGTDAYGVDASTETPAVEPVVEPTRRGRARERVRRRKQTQGPAVAPPVLAREGSRAIPRAISPATRPSQVGLERAPRLDLSGLPVNAIRIVLYFIGALILIIGVIFALSQFSNDAPTAGPNAIWIGTEWTYDTRTDADVEALAAQLRENQIGTVYAWVAWVPASGEWSGGSRPYSEREPNIARFVTQFKQAYPEARLFSWLGVPVEDRATGIPYRLNDTAFHQNVAEFSAYTINDLGFDGVFLNVEIVWDHYGDDFIQLINTVRLEIRPGAEIAIPVIPDWTPDDANIPKPTTIVPGTILSRDLKERLLLITDQIAVMAYNSALTSPFDYIDWYAYQVETYARTLDEMGGAGVELLIGIPTYGNEPPGHDVNVENMSTAINGLRKGIDLAGNAGRHVTGAAIYGWWETDETEWLQFNQGWVNR